MRILALATFACATSLAAAPPAKAPGAAAPAIDRVLPGGRIDGRECRKREVTPAGAIEAPRPQNLAELPPGDTILAVYKEVEGCMEPVIVRYGDGRGPDAVSPPAEPQRPQARLYR